MSGVEDRSHAFFFATDPDDHIDAAFLLSRTGVVIASWTRKETSSEIVSVMAATMMGSIEALIQAMGGKTPQSALVKTDSRLLLVRRIDSRLILALIASPTCAEEELWQASGKILARVSADSDIYRKSHPMPARS